MFTVQADDTEMIDWENKIKHHHACVVERFQLLIIFKRVVPCVKRVFKLEADHCVSRHVAQRSKCHITASAEESESKPYFEVWRGDRCFAVAILCFSSSSFHWLFYYHLVCRVDVPGPPDQQGSPDKTNPPDRTTGPVDWELEAGQK